MKPKTINTNAPQATIRWGQQLAASLKKGRVIALTGNLGSGKTTFVQGLLKGLGVKGPHTSPTFLIIKHYRRKTFLNRRSSSNGPKTSRARFQNIYHVDAYRVVAKDILNLGWKEIIADKNNIVIVEWADRIKKIIPKKAIWINFKWIDNHIREIDFKLPRKHSRKG